MHEIADKLVPETAPARRMWTAKLGDAETFEAYSKEIGGERFAKFVIDLKSDAIYYFDVNVYAVDKDFIFQELYKKPTSRAPGCGRRARPGRRAGNRGRPNKGKPVLTNKKAIKLVDTAHRLTKLFKNPKLDIEWVFVDDDLFIVQTRPLVGQ